MYWNAESVTVDDDEGRFTLVIEDVEGERVTVNIHGIDLDAFYDQVKARIGPYLREMHEARDAVARGVTLREFVCAPADVDESAGMSEYAVATREDGSLRMEPDEDAYDPTDPKHRDFHSVHADLYDNRAGK
jgi:hypothetical protein